MNRKKALAIAGGLAAVLAVIVAVALRAGSSPEELGDLWPVQKRTPRRAATPSPAAPAVDLLSLVDARLDAVAGDWGFQERALITSATPYGRLQFPCRPSEEYDLRLKATRKRGSDSLAVGFVYRGRQGMLVLGGHNGESSWIFLDGADDRTVNSTTVSGRVFPWNKTLSISLAVREGGVNVEIDGKPFLAWKGAASELYEMPGFRVPDSRALFVGTWDTTYAIDEFELAPLKGQPVLTRPAATAARP